MNGVEETEKVESKGIVLTPAMFLYISMAISNIIRALMNEASEMTPEELALATATEELRKERLSQRAKES